MKLRTVATTAALALAGAGSTLALAGGTAARADIPSVTVHTVNTAAGSSCYTKVKTEMENYTHSATKGWLPELTPHVTLASSETCYAASGPQTFTGVTETVDQVNAILSAYCYSEYKQTIVYATHSSTKGWVAEPAPRVTTEWSTHCYATA